MYIEVSEKRRPDFNTYFTSLSFKTICLGWLAGLQIEQIGKPNMVPTIRPTIISNISNFLIVVRAIVCRILTMDSSTTINQDKL